MQNKKTHKDQNILYFKISIYCLFIFSIIYSFIIKEGNYGFGVDYYHSYQFGYPSNYFFYDFHEFLAVRGFVNNDYFELCKGPISYNSGELCSVLNDFLIKGLDSHSSDRKEFSVLVNNKNDSSFTRKNIDYLDIILN